MAKRKLDSVSHTSIEYQINKKRENGVSEAKKAKIILPKATTSKHIFVNTDFYGRGRAIYLEDGVKYLKVEVTKDKIIDLVGFIEFKSHLYKAVARLAWSDYQRAFDLVGHSSDYSSYYDDCMVAAMLYFVYENQLRAVNQEYKKNPNFDYYLEHMMQEYAQSKQTIMKELVEALPTITLPATGPFQLALELKDKYYFNVKVGEANGRLYVVRNINEFVNDMAVEKPIKIGKKEAIIKESDLVDERSRRIYNLLKEVGYYSYDTKTLTIISYFDLLVKHVEDILIEKGIKYKIYDSIPVYVSDFDVYYRLSSNIGDADFTIQRNNVIARNKNSYSLYRLNDPSIRFFKRVNSALPLDLPMATKENDLNTIAQLTKGKIEFIDNGSVYTANCYPIEMYFDMDDHGDVTLAIKFRYDDDTLTNALDESNQHPELVMIQNFIKPYIESYDEERKCFVFDVTKQKARQFLQSGLEPLKKYGKVFASDEVMNIVKAKHISKVKTGIRFSNGLLHVDFDEDNIDPSEWSAILKQYKRKKKYYQLQNGDMLELDKNPVFDDVLTLMERLDVSVDDIDDKGSVVANEYRLLGLEDTFDKMDLLDINRDETYQHALNHYIEYNPKNYKVPTKYKKLFRDYQKQGYKWLSYMIEADFNPILADDMGLGKTLQVLALLETIKDQGSNLIVAPATLVYNWKDEISKFEVDIDAICVVGNAQQRASAYNEKHDLYITSYDYMRRDFPLLEDINFNVIILDEAQYIKNSTTKNAESVKALQSNHRIALTGTPIENTLAELWSIFDFLMPGYLYSYKTFKKLFEKPIVTFNDEQASSDLKHLVSPFILRRVKKQVLNELPEKFEIIQSVDFNEEEKKVYEAQLNSVSYQIQHLDFQQPANKVKLLAMLLRLRQLCCDLRLVYEDIKTPSSKVESAFEIIETVKAEGNKVLLFSSFTSMLDLLAARANELGIKFHKLTGSDSKEKRKNMIAEFNSDDSTLFLISLKAGGTGLNLTAANTVIHFDPWWNQSATNQASDRAYRIGQEKDVTVYKLVMRDSLEEKIVTLQEKKQALADEFIQSNSGSLTQLSKEEILSLFK